MVRRVKFSLVLIAGALLGASAQASTPVQSAIETILSPLGRYVLGRTPRGSAIAQKVLGLELSEIARADGALIASKLMQNESSARALAEQLNQIRVSIVAVAGTNPDVPLDALIRKLADAHLRVQVRGGKAGLVRTQVSPDVAKVYQALTSSAAQSEKATSMSFIAQRIYGQEMLGLSVVGQDLRFVEFNRVVLRESNLASSRLNYVRILGSDLRESSLMDADLGFALIEKTDLRRVNAAGARLQGTRFVQTKGAYADFTSADLRGADLRGIDFGGDFPHDAAQITARFRGALIDRGTQLPFDRATAESLGMIFVK